MRRRFYRSTIGLVAALICSWVVSAQAQTVQSSVPLGHTTTGTPSLLILPGLQAEQLFLQATGPQRKTYFNTSLLACPTNERLLYFYYYQDTPDFRGSSWCGAAQADIDWANRTDPVRWRVPYILESCQPGVVWYYSHAWPNGSRYYSPGYRDINMICEADECPVEPLAAVTDSVALEFEQGMYRNEPDLAHISDAVRAGYACIRQKAAAMGATVFASSGYRSQAYQNHLREVWDKWAQLRNEDSEACRDRKAHVI